MPSTCHALFRSRTRESLLRLLFVERRRGSMSELARRARLGTRTVALEVRNLRSANLVCVEAVGPADVVFANEDHPSYAVLRSLLRGSEAGREDRSLLLSSLAFYGAPLLARPRASMPLEEAIVSGLEAAKSDATILRVLPLVLAAHVDAVDWPGLEQLARQKKLKAHLGFLVELTARLAGRPDMRPRVAHLHDRRQTKLHYLPVPKNAYESRLANRHKSPLAARWGFILAEPQESFRALFEKHHG